MKRIIILQIVMLMACLNVYCSDALLGPYIMDTESSVETPAGYTRVYVWSTPEYTGGSITLSGENGSFTINGSVTYRNQWMYFIKNGSYTVASLSSGYSVVVNGMYVSKGGYVTFTGVNGMINFSPNSSSYNIKNKTDNEENISLFAQNFCIPRIY